MQNSNQDDTNPSEQDDADTKPTDLGDTQLSKAEATENVESSPPADSEPQGYQEPDTKPRPKQRGRKILIVALLFLLIVIMGSAGGYFVGINDRVSYENEVVATQVFDQFMLGLQDMQLGRYNSARQRFEWVIITDPNFPGAKEQLSLAIQAELATQTPTLAPTPTQVLPTATKDIRGIEELFNAALAARGAQDWDTLISTLDAIRKDDPAFRTIEVDGMYFMGFRNRGEKRILLEGNLEMGIFDLTQAEHFGPLDNRAKGYKQWAVWYLTGASFWEVDWGQAITYFQLIVPVAPNLSDSEFFTAEDRLATAEPSWGIVLVDQGELYLYNQDWCAASDALEEAWLYVTPDPFLQPTAQAAKEKCKRNK